MGCPHAGQNWASAFTWAPHDAQKCLCADVVDGIFSLTVARCLGSCGLAPVVVFDGEVSGKETPEAVTKRALEIVTLARERALQEAEAA